MENTNNSKVTRKPKTKTFYEQLVDLRANHHGGFINDRGYKNKKSPNDKIGITYAYWATINALKMD